MLRLGILLTLTCIGAPLSTAQTVKVGQGPLFNLLWSGGSESQAGGPIVSRFVGPFTTTQEVDRMQQFLNEPCVFQWHQTTTIRGIQRELARYLPVELDVRAIEEIGLSSDTPLIISDRNAADDNRAIEHEKNASSVESEPSDTAIGSVNKWWTTADSDPSSKPVVTNGAKLLYYLDSVDLTLNLQSGQLVITTWEQAEQDGCVCLYDVTPLLDLTAPSKRDTDPQISGEERLFQEIQSLSDVIQTTVSPDTWEILGGPSTIASYSTGKRCWLVVNTPLTIHWKVAALLNRLNE